MSSATILGTAAAVVVFALPALAFGQAQTPMSGPGVDTAMPMTAPATSMATTPNTGMSSTPSAQSAGVNTNGAVVDPSQAPADQVQALKQGDNTTVTNGPVPDTKANRAKYGRPMSNAGKKTPPAGN